MKRQVGLAAVTALLIVALAASTAALMLSQQSSMLDQSSMVVARAQADSYAQTGVDWARGILLDDGRRGQVDSLNEQWAQPIPALPVERAVVSGRIEDEQGKFNLNNLAGNGSTPQDESAFRTLLSSLQLSPELVHAVQDWIDADQDARNGGAENPYYLALAKPYRAANVPMVQVEELYRVKGFDAAAVAKLRPYVTALPVHTAINVNTASDVVVGAIYGVPPEKVASLLAQRVATPFPSVDKFKQALASVGGEPQVALDVASHFFSVHVQVAQDDVQLASDALVQREPNKPPVVLWRRPRY